MSDADDLLEYAETDELRETARRLQQKLADAKAKTAELIDAVYRAARDAALMQPTPKATPRPKVDRRKRAEVALTHLTDLQFGKATESYSRDICDRRVDQYLGKIEKVTDVQRSDHPVREGHMMLGGDMVEGTKIFPGQVFEIEAYLYDQLFGCAALIERAIRNMLGIFETVTVWEESGNHGRMGKKGEDPAMDNIDRMAYRIAKDRLANEPRLTWVPQDSWYRIVEIGNYRALLVHGDEIKSFGGNTPAFGILRKCNAWSSGVVPQFDDVYMGHFHTNMVLTMANGGRVFVSSSTESGSVYAQEFVAATGVPAQRLNFIDPEAGRVAAEYVCWLD